MTFPHLTIRNSIISCFVTLAAVASAGLAATTTTVPAAGSASSKPKATAADAEFSGMVARFLAQPNKENFSAVQDRIVADRGYDQTARGLDDMLELYRQKQYAKAIDCFQSAQPDLALSPQAHFYAARCYEELGQKEMQKKEMAFVRACLEGLLATGDGSPERPFVVTHASDEYDLLTCPLKTESKSQSSTHKKGRWYDVLECANGKTYWFDITMTFGGESKSAAAAIAAGNTKQVAKPAAGQIAKSVEKSPAKLEKAPTKLVAAREADAVPPTTIPAAAFAAFDRGVDEIKRRDYDHAIADFDEVLRLDPSSADALFERGATYIEKRNFNAAYQDLSRSIQLRPGLALAYYERGIALWQAGDKARFDDAIADFSQAIRLIPSDFLAWRSRAMVQFAKQEYRKAIDDFSEAIRLHPGDVTAHNNRGFALESVGEYSRAIADFNLAIRLQPQSAPAYAGRGFAWLSRGEYELAIADLDEAIRLQPDYAAAYTYRSSAYAHQGDEARAQSDATLAEGLRAKQ